MKILKIAFTIFIAVLIPVYWYHYGPKNFLWLSDVGLFLTLFGLWFESPLCMSICAVGIMPLELLWCVDFFVQLGTGFSLIHLAHYMFNPDFPLYLRGLSLFHVALPIIWIYYLHRWGYDRRAFKYMTTIIVVLLPISYLVTEPYRRINWVHLPELNNWDWMPPLMWVGILIIGFITFIFLPMHLLLKKLLPMPTSKESK